MLRGEAGSALLESYNDERTYAADENILNSTRATDFMTPKTAVERAFGEAVIELAASHPFARAFVNSGRLSVPCHQRQSRLTTPDSAPFAGALAPGDVCLDAPVLGPRGERWLLELLGGRFACLYFVGDGAPEPDAVRTGLPHDVALLPVSRDPRAACLQDVEGLVAARYDGQPGTLCLVRPDQHLAARWRRPDFAALHAALARASA